MNPTPKSRGGKKRYSVDIAMVPASKSKSFPRKFSRDLICYQRPGVTVMSLMQLLSISLTNCVIYKRTNVDRSFEKGLNFTEIQKKFKSTNAQNRHVFDSRDVRLKTEASAYCSSSTGPSN